MDANGFLTQQVRGLVLKTCITLYVLAISLLFANPAEARRHRGYTPWCGIYMMQHKGIHKPGLALARNWAREGVHGTVVILLRLLVAGKIAVSDIEALR